MNIATILFTYNRSWHTKEVLDALAKNRVLPTKLFIFHDGMKESTNKEEWDAVNDVITSVSWCDTEVIISEKNKGLAESVKAGVNFVFQNYDAVIVLEDDCVPHPQFMEYMIQALKKYEKNKEVYHIGASSEPVDIEGKEEDAYFLGRINSCGWATWKDRWEQFSNDYTMIKKIKMDKQLSEWFRLWGEDLESHVLGNVTGETDSWAAFWALTVIMQKGYCMSPYESLIYNIGFDGTGVHSGIAKNTLKMRPVEKVSEIILPDKIELVDNYKNIFADYHRWTSPAIRNAYYKNVAFDMLEMEQRHLNLMDFLKNKGINNVAVWGRGKLCDYLLDELNNEIEITVIVESAPGEKKYREIPLVNWKGIPNNVSLIVVVPGYDIDRIKCMIKDPELIDKLMPIDRLTDEILQNKA